MNIAAISEENKILKTTVRMLEAVLRSVTTELNELQQYGRRECVENRGIPMAIDNERENTNEIAIEVDELMNVKIAPEDISVSHRLKSSRDYKGIAAK